MTRNIFISFLFFTITVISQTSIDYYPLKVGYEWKYKLGPEGLGEERFIVTEADKYDSYLIKHMMNISEQFNAAFPFINEKLLQKKDGKVLLLGEHNLLSNTNWEFYDNIIILESNLQLGQSWKNEKPNGDFEEYKVIDISDFSVAAGNFKDVLIINKNMGGIDDKSKKRKIIIRTKEYYAPNVGLIKVEVFEPSKNAYEAFQELVEYKH